MEQSRTKKSLRSDGLSQEGLPGLVGHFWHLFRPQEAPTLPQQSSCLVRPGRGLPHYDNNNTSVLNLRNECYMFVHACFFCMQMCVGISKCVRVRVCVYTYPQGQSEPDTSETS